MSTQRASLATLTLVFLSLIMSTWAANPGVKARITKKAIDYASGIAQDAVHKELANLKIGDQSGSEHHFSWSFTRIQNRGVTMPSSVISLDAAKNGLDWSISNLGLSLRADWRVKYRKGWVKASTSGSVDVDVKSVSVRAAIAIGKDANGRPSVSSAACSDAIGGVDLHFHGGAGWLINLFRHSLEKRVKNMLTGQICKVVNKQINVDGEAKAQKVKVTAELAHKFLLDYRFTAIPSVTQDYLETQHKGEIYWEKDQKEAPFTPLPIPPSADVSRMMYIWLTEFTANSYAFAAQSHGYLNRSFTSMDLPADHRGLFNTTCQTMCIGKLIPKIGQACPNSVVYMTVTSTVSPTLTITNQSAVLTAQGKIDMFATTPNKTEKYLMTISMNVSLGLTGQIEKETLIGQISSHKFKFDVAKSNVGNVSSRGLNMMLNIAMNTAVIPQLNDLGKKGFPLPASGDVTFVNSSLQFLKGSLLVATDLKYNGNLLKFESERH